MAVQVRTISPSANLQNWTPTGATGAARLTAADGDYVESTFDTNTASGTLNLASPFSLPSDAVINTVIIRTRVRLATPGSRIMRCGFNGSATAATQSLVATEWTDMDFPVPYNILVGASEPWTRDGVNSIAGAYLRAYADADGPVVHADYLAIIVEYSSNEAPDPDPISIPDVAAIRSGSTYITKVNVGQTTIWPLPAADIQMTVQGTSFAPQIELMAGSTATVNWQSNDAVITGTDTAPIFNWALPGPHVVSLTVSKRSHLTTINLGFDSTDDVGYFGPGPAYDYAPQSVVAITGLRYLTGLKRFLAANGPLAGTVDLTGCSSLEFIECFGANIDALALHGCSSLIRLCVEANNIPLLDLNTVRNSLRDLRAAAMQSGTLEFTSLESSLTKLYHFCVRSQTLVNPPTLTQMPVIEQWWVWNCGIVDPGTPTSSVLNSVLAHNNAMPQATVDTILQHISTNVPRANGSIRLEGSAAPSAVGEAAANALIARGGWSVTTTT